VPARAPSGASNGPQPTGDAPAGFG